MKTEQGVISLFPENEPPTEMTVFLAAHAEAIRVLGRRMARDIVEIGQRLKEVRETVSRGKWLPWLDKEFKWSHRVATEFIRIAEAFDSKLDDSSSLQIDYGALYLLSDPLVPEEKRDEAITKASTGERVTLAEARKIIGEEVAEQMQAVRDEARRNRDAAVKAATEELRAQLDQLRATEKREPTVQDAIDLILKIRKRKTMTRNDAKAVAMLTGMMIRHNDEYIGPMAPEDEPRAERELQVTSDFMRSLQFYGQSPLTVDEVFAASAPFQRRIARETIPLVMQWLNRFNKLLDKEGEA